MMDYDLNRPKNRVLNRHKRGRPKLTLWQKISRRVLPPTLVVGIIAAGVYLLDYIGLI